MSTELRSFLSARDVLVDVPATCKRGVLRTLSAHAAQSFGVDETALLESLLERERIGTTGIGQGVAVPHARTTLKEMHGVLARLSTPIDFDAIDEQPVDLVFMLLAPHERDAEHLKALSRIARLVRTDLVQSGMRGAADATTLHAIAIGEGDAAAA